MFIQTEQTPNPLTLKFLPGRVVMEEGTAFFQIKDEAINSPFAKRIFEIDGVNGVFFGSDFITVTKNEENDWQVLKPVILGAILDHFNSEDKIIIPSLNEKNKQNDEEETDVIKQIKELLDTRVRPAVAMDGGDIIYDRFVDGVVYLHMQGACSGCPSSTATLKMGIENMLKHYVPEVTEVRPV